MRNCLVVFLLAALLLTSLGGCYSIQYLPTGEEVKSSKQIIYLFWGATPLGNNTVKSGQLVEEKFTAVDYIINIFTLGIVSGRTIEAR